MIEVDYRAKGDAVIIVGGNSGIGISLINQLLVAGAKCVSIDIQVFSQIETHPLLTYIQCDPTIKDSLEQVRDDIIKDHHEIIGLVNLSGTIKYFGLTEEASHLDWQETYDISFLSCLNSCQVFTPLLRRAEHASIVNMASGLAFIGQKNYGPYSAAKAAIVSLTKTLAVELAPRIRVNAIAPGAVDTDFIYTNDGSTRFDIANYQKRVLTGEIGKPSEIAHLITFLLSNGASHINGQCISINGGIG